MPAELSGDHLATVLRRAGAVWLTGALLLAILFTVAPAQPAHADRCQPEEFVLGSGNSPYGEDDSAFCDVMIGQVYPRLVQFGCDSSTLLRCINGMTPSPVPNVTNPVPAQGPLPGQVARPIYCAMDTVGGDSLYCGNFDQQIQCAKETVRFESFFCSIGP